MPFRFDMHVHTSRHSEDSQLNPFRMMRRALRQKLSGIVITEHDHLWMDEELEELRSATPEIRVFSGVEVSAREGHFLCYGIKDIKKTPKGISLAKLCEEVHRQKGAIAAAHPYRWGQDFSAIMRESPDLDGFEVMSKNMGVSERNKIKELLGTLHRPPFSRLGNSDAHEEETIGQCVTLFPNEIRDERDLVEAIRCGEGEAEDTESIRLLRGNNKGD